MNAELANLAKEIGRIAKTKSDSVEMLLKFMPLHTHREMMPTGTLYGCLQK